MARISRLWTKEEIDLLYLWANDVPLERIASRLKRTQSSVKSKAHELGLTLRPTVDHLSIKSVADILQCSRGSLLYWIEKGALVSRKSSPQTVSVPWRIKRSQLKKFYKANPNLRIFKNAPKESLEWLIG